MKEYYDILEIPYGSRKDEIKKAFRRLAHIHHPDKKGGDEEKFKQISRAYTELLKMPESSASPFTAYSGRTSDIFSQYAQQQAAQYQRQKQQRRYTNDIVRQGMIKNLEMRIANARTRRSIIDMEISSLESELRTLRESE